MRYVTIHCKCCDLAQRVKDRGGDPPSICQACSEHRGVDDLSLRRRAESHLAMITERLAAARLAADAAYRDRDIYKEKMHAAYGSRERAIRYLLRLSDLHQPLGRGACTCRARGCESMLLLDHPWVRDRIRQLQRIDEQRELELRAIDPRDDWSIIAWDRPIEQSRDGSRAAG